MEVKTRVSIRNPEALRKRIIRAVLPRVEVLVRDTIEAYLLDLSKHMGSISGGNDYSGDGLHWEALDEETMEDAPKFWLKTGKAKRSISVNFQVRQDEIKAFVGITEHSPGYKEALWNELGFTPGKGDRLIRRPLFFPLAEAHQAELKEKIQNTLQHQRVRLEV